MKPIFKENDGGDQFTFRDGKWEPSSESEINDLWSSWVINPNAERWSDDEGFTVFGYKEVNND